MCAETLTQLAQRVRKINGANGWKIRAWGIVEDSRSIPTCLALVHSEVSEALEAYRNDDRNGFAEELADIVIRVLDIAAFLKINLDEEIAAKLEKNKSRGFRHGGKKV